MTQSEYKDQLLKYSFTKYFRIALKLGVSNLIIIDKGEKHFDRFNYRVRELNPYNPLTYIFILITIIPLFIIILFKNLNEVTYEIKKLFRYS